VSIFRTLACNVLVAGLVLLMGLLYLTDCGGQTDQSAWPGATRIDRWRGPCNDDVGCPDGQICVGIGGGPDSGTSDRSCFVGAKACDAIDCGSGSCGEFDTFPPVPYCDN
jgi:hypothetical protein